MELPQLHLRHIMLYEFRGNTSASQTHRNITEIYGNVIGVDAIQRKFSQFRTGNFTLEDKPGRGRKLKVDVDQLKGLVESDPRQTTGEMATILQVSEECVRLHLHEIGKEQKYGVWIPKEISPNQMKQRLTIASAHLSSHNLEPFLQRIVTGDEK